MLQATQMTQELPPAGASQAMHPTLDMKAELIVNEVAEAMVLHNKPFHKELSWLEYDLTTSRLDFIMEDGDIRDFGLAVDPQLSNYLQNAHQVLMVLVDETSETAKEEGYLPLIIHKD